MPLNIIIIGRGQSECPKETKGGHRLTFIDHARKANDLNAGIKEISGQFDYILIHINNAEAVDAITEFRDRQGYANKIIGISTGNVSSEFTELGIAAIDSIGSMEDVLSLRWSRVPSNFHDNATALASLLIRTDGKPYLAATSILCQGYLAAQAEKRNTADPKEPWGPSDITDVLLAMGWNDEVYMACSKSIEAKRDLVKSAKWWSSVLGTKAQVMNGYAKELDDEEWVKQPRYGDLMKLLRVIYSEMSKGTQGSSEPELVNRTVVRDAYRCLDAEFRRGL